MNKQKTIGIVNTEFYRNDLGGFGGFGSLCTNLTNYYDTADSKLVFKLFLTMRHSQRKLHAHNAEVFPFQRTSKPLQALINYRNLVKHQNIDVFLTIEWYHVYLLPLLNDPKTPIIFWLQDPRNASDWANIRTCNLAYHTESNPSINPWGNQYSFVSYQFLRKMGLLRKANFIPATQARFLRKKGAEKYHDKLFLNSVFLPNPIKISERGAFKKAEKPTLLYLGRMDPIKRPWLFFELARRLPDYDFLVAGKTHQEKIMGDNIRVAQKIPNLHFLGLVNGPEKEEVLKKSWILVNTSIHEALPVSFLEGLSYKMPIISNRNPDGITERFGVHVKKSLGDGYDSIPEFVSAIKRLVNNDVLRRDLGEKGYDYVKNNHSFNAFERQLSKILNIGE